jgi:hypothetical protein
MARNYTPLPRNPKRSVGQTEDEKFKSVVKRLLDTPPMHKPTRRKTEGERPPKSAGKKRPD